MATEAPTDGAPCETADLFHGAIEHNLARKLRDLSACTLALSKSVEEVAARQSRRRKFKAEPTGDDIRSAHKQCVPALQSLQSLVEPTGPDGISAMPVPHTMSDWTKCRLELELQLHAAFTDTQIAQLLPRGGTERNVSERRYRDRKRHRANTSLLE